MSENSHSPHRGPEPGSTQLSTRDLTALPQRLLLSQTPSTDSDLLSQLDALERIKSAACALQAQLTHDLIGLRPVTRAGTIAATVTREVGLARQESPHTAASKVRLARALLRDLPATYAALCAGDLSEHRAQIIADETRHLDHETRREADRQISTRLGGLGDKRLTHAIRRIVMRLDEAGTTARTERALAERHVRIRTLANGTARVSAITSTLHAAAIATSLNAATEQAIRDRGDQPGEPGSDQRTRAQITADIAAERLAGLDPATGSTVPIAVNLVISAESLIGTDGEPAHLPGHGPLPAGIARRLVAASDPLRSTIRRLFAMPGEGTLVAAESGSRCYPPEMRDLITIRDDICRTPFCNAPIRHADHVQPAAAGGPTTLRNGQGLCAWCNYTKDHPGWRSRTTSADFDPHRVTITTPTGRHHHSRAPDTVLVQRTRTMEGYLAALTLDATDYRAA